MAVNVKTEKRNSGNTLKRRSELVIFFIAIFAFLFFYVASLPLWIFLVFAWIYGFRNKEFRLKFNQDENYKKKGLHVMKFLLIGLFVSSILAIICIMILGWVSFILFEAISTISLCLGIIIISKKGEDNTRRYARRLFNLGHGTGAESVHSIKKKKVVSKKRGRPKPSMGKTISKNVK